MSRRRREQRAIDNDPEVIEAADALERVRQDGEDRVAKAQAQADREVARAEKDVADARRAAADRLTET